MFPLGITPITRYYSDYSDYSDLLGLLLITPFYFGLLRITPDYFGLLGSFIRVVSFSPWDYRGLLRNLPDSSDYPRLAVQIIKWSSGLPDLFLPSGLPRITVEYPRLLGFLGLLRYFPDYSNLFRTTADYSGSPVQITKWCSELPELFPLGITPDCSYYIDLLGLLLITPIYFRL